MTEAAAPQSPDTIKLPQGHRHRLATLAGAVASAAIIGVALWFLHRELSGLSRDAVMGHIRSLPVLALFAAAGFTILSYFILTGYDATAVRYLGRRLPYPRIALTSFMAFAVGHNVGLMALSGGSIRYRMYSLAGLSSAEIARVVVFVSGTFVIGASGLLGIALLLLPDAQTAVLKLSPAIVSAVGIALSAVPCLYILGSFLRRAPLALGSWQIAVPQPSLAISQVAISVADLTFAAATLFVLLAPSLDIGFVPFLGLYLLALGAGVVSNIPGGLGVFEAVLVALLPQVQLSALLGTVIVYRLIYYVGPLTVALVLMVAHEARQHGRLLLRSSQRSLDWLSSIAPQAIGALVFLAGIVLLVSGASPAVETRLGIVARGIPLALLELSHLAGSMVGVGLLILARGLYRRLHGAHTAALLTLVAGMMLSLLKGLDYEEALILSIILAALWFSRAAFYRVGSVATQRFSLQWIAAILVVLGFTVWVRMVSFRHVNYSDRLWWQFAFDAQAPRMLRATAVAAFTAASFALWKVLRAGPKAVLGTPPSDEIACIKRVVAQATTAAANAALIGDKRFLWSPDRQAFIMYGISGDSFIALGGPVGPTRHYEELVWSFRELVDRHDGRPVFYEVGEGSLPLYVDLGLTLSKLGEEGRVSLKGFSLEGSHRAELRQAINRAKKHGAVFEIVPRDQVPQIASELRRVSESWLADKNTAEKGFSLGAFSEDYVANFDCAVVHVEGVIVAFANLWPAPAGGELSIDLMRYDQAAPKAVMDSLFAQLMLWGAENGYEWFELGMAPLAGLEARALAPLWHKMGNLVYAHGENFYNFEGLRSYKEKFEPEWQPRYLACPGGWLNLSLALLDTSRLISGGVTGMLAKN